MKNLSRRFLACFLALTLLMTCVPAMVLAEDHVDAAAEAALTPQSRSATTKPSPTVSRSTVSYTVYDVASLQSPHSYPNNADYHYIYSVPSASYLDITFSSSTYVENGCDYISISTGTGKLVGTYTGVALSGRTIRVPSGTVDIHLKTDQSSAFFGFQVTKITNNLQNQNTLQSRETIGDVNLGKSVIGKAWQTAGRPMSFYIWQVFDSNGGLVYQTNVGGNSSEFSYTPSKSGSYCLAVTGYDGANYSNTAYSNWFSVLSTQPTTISVSLDGSRYGYGGKVTITARQLTGNPILFYHCIIINDSGRRIYEFDSSSPTMTYNAPYYNCTLCAIVQAYDGRAWCSEYSDWFAVSSSTPQQPSQQKTSISVSLSASNIAVGGSVVATVRVLSGGPVQSYHYVLMNSAGATLETHDTTSTQVEATIGSAGTYRLLVQAYDGREWCYAYSDWFSATAASTPSQQTAITASLSASSVNVGQVMTVTARVVSGGPIQFYHYEVYSENGQMLTSADLGINTFTYAPSTTGRQRVLVQAYDGKTWCATYTDWFTVNSAQPQTAISASLSATTVNVGQIITITARVVSGGPIQFYHYEVYNENGLKLTAVDLGINTFTYAPSATGRQRVLVQAYDGKNWCETYTDWFTVNKAQPQTAITASLSATTVNVGDVLTVTARVTSGGPVQFYHYEVLTESGQTLTAVDLGINTFTYAPGTTGRQRVKVQAYDGKAWCETYTGWFTVVNNKPTYRALLIGQTYPGEGTTTLPGCDNDVTAMNSMLGNMSSTPYKVNRQLNLTASQILTSISTAFSGATSKDVSLFYYSGHGLYSTNSSRLGALCGVRSSGYVTAADLRAALDKIPGTKIVILDSCRSGNMIGKGVDDELSLEEERRLNQDMVEAFMNEFLYGSQPRSSTNLAASNYYVLCAASSRQDSLTLTNTLTRFSFGEFTRRLTYGSGWDYLNKSRLSSLPADTNRDNSVSLNELYVYLQKNYDQGRGDYNAQVYPSGSSFKLFGR